MRVFGDFLDFAKEDPAKPSRCTGFIETFSIAPHYVPEKVMKR